MIELTTLLDGPEQLLACGVALAPLTLTTVVLLPLPAELLEADQGERL